MISLTSWIGRFLVKILDGITEEYDMKVRIRKSQLLHQEVHQEENLHELRKKLKMRRQKKCKIYKRTINPF